MSNEDRIRTALEIAEWRGDDHERPLEGNYNWAATTLAEAYRAQQWQPIETAPKNGLLIRIYGEYLEGIAAWHGDKWVIDDNLGIVPTHWMPLTYPDRTTP